MNWLKNPYPFIFEDRSTRLKLSLFVFTFVSFFLLVFKPFSFDHLIRIPLLNAAFSYGLMASVVSLVVVKFCMLLWPKQVNEQKWTAGRELILLNLILLSITIANLFLSKYTLINGVTASNFFACLKEDLLHTYSIGFFPVILMTLLNYSVRLRTNLLASQKLNSGINELDDTRTSNAVSELVEIKSTVKSNDIVLSPSNLIYLMADGNYVEFHLFESGQYRREIIRNTLNNIEEQLANHNFLFRSHRTYMVNMNCIEDTKGNAQGYQLSLRNSEHTVPVSRTKLSEFNARFSEFRS
jgi:hypothetical protein